MISEEIKNDPTETKIETKYQTPSRFDTAPYGQIWKVIGEKNEVTIWVQTSKVEGEPNWVDISAIFNSDVQEILFLCQPDFHPNYLSLYYELRSL